MSVVMGVTFIGIISFLYVDVRDKALKVKHTDTKKKKIGTRIELFFNAILPIEFTGQPWLVISFLLFFVICLFDMINIGIFDSISV
jgi:hypothetical protein